MARPPITAKFEGLFRQQLNAAFDYVESLSGGGGSIDSLSDVIITGPTSGQVLKWNGAAWVNDTDATGGGGVSDGDKGDITVSGGGATWTIDANAVTLAKIATIADGRLLGNNTGGASVPVELTAAQVKTLLALVIADTTGLQDALDSGSVRVSRDYVGQNTTGLINALKVTAGRFAGAYRARDVGNVVWYFPFSAMTLVPEAFTQAERQACVAAAIDRAVVGPRQNTAAYGQYTLVQFASGKIFYCNLAGTSAGSAPSDAGVTTAGDFLGDGTITWEYTGLQAPTTWEWHILDVDTGLSAMVFPDSHDAYAGMLASAAEMAKVDAAWLATASAHPGMDRMEVIDQLITSNMTDQLNGTSPGPRLTYTFQDGVDETGAAYTFRFLADNVEAWRGYRAQVALRTIAGLSTTVAEQNAADVKEGVLALFVGGRFQVYEGQNPAHLALAGDGDMDVLRFGLWPMLHGMLETLTEIQTYADAVLIDTVAVVPGLFTEALDTFPMGEWYAAAADKLGVIEAQDALAWRITSRNVANLTIVDAALGVREAEIRAEEVTDLKETVQAYTLDTFANPVASLDFAQQQTLQFVIENRVTDPASPALGQIWLYIGP